MSQEGPHLLFCAFAEVPGPTSMGTRVEQLVTAFSDEFDVDAMTLKGPELAHIQRMGAARVMRVPTEGKPFLERLAAYRRALQRQLSGDHYDFVYCADLFSAGVAAAFRESQGFALVVDVADFPSESFDGKWPVDRANRQLRSEWSRAEAHALLQATHVIAPSRYAARELAQRVDARRVQIHRRAVDRTIFTPPSIEIGLDGHASVVVVGREAGARLAPTVALLTELADQLGDDVRLAVLGQAPPEGNDTLLGALAATGLSERVDLISVDTHVRMANALSDATVVVVPSGAEGGTEPFAVPHRALEAMACRRPVVVTGPFEAFRDTLVPDEEALVVPAGDPKEVTLAVRRLLEAPALRDAIAGAGLRRVEHEADLSVRTHELATFITETIGVAMTPRAPESTDPAATDDDDDPTGISQLPPEASSLPPPPFDTMDSGKHARDEVALREEPARPPPSKEVPTPFDTLDPVPTDIHTAESSVFTDEDRSEDLPAPRAPEPPRAADRAASSIDASAVGGPADTIVAPAPSGLDPLRVEQVQGLEHLDTEGTQLGDDWYGDTRIEPPKPSQMPPSFDDEETFKRVAATSTASDSNAEVASLRSLAVEADGTQSGSSPLGESDPWAHDTIADAGPVFTDEKSEPKKDTPAPVSAAGNFLVDREATADAMTNPALDEATVDESSLPADSSGEG